MQKVGKEQWSLNNAAFNSRCQLCINFIYDLEYTKIGDFIDTNDIDVAIRDALSSPCVKASLTAGIPFIVTSSLPQGEGEINLTDQ